MGRVVYLRLIADGSHRGWSHQEGHRHRPGRPGARDRLAAARGRPASQPGTAEGAGGLRAGRDHAARPDAGGLVHVRDRHQPRRARHLRLPPPQPQDLSARPGAEPLRAEERLPAAQGRQPAAGNAGLGAAGSRRQPVDRPALSLHVSARPVRGRMLSGMGVPDLRGGLGTSTFYTDRQPVTPRESENVVRPEPAGDGHVLDPPDRSAQSQGGRRPARRGHAARRSPTTGEIRFSSDGTPKSWRFARAVERLAAGQVQARAAPVDPRHGAVPPV